MDDRLKSYDWEEAFRYAAMPQVVGRATVSTNEFTRDDVKLIISIADGQNDGASWIGAFQLCDGRYAFLSAWCDYTGWG